MPTKPLQIDAAAGKQQLKYEGKGVLWGKIVGKCVNKVVSWPYKNRPSGYEKTNWVYWRGGGSLSIRSLKILLLWPRSWPQPQLHPPVYLLWRHESSLLSLAVNDD